MPQEVVTIKGTRQGLVIQFKGQTDLGEVKEALKAKLEGARGFFQGARFILSPSCPLTSRQTAELEELCRYYGLVPAQEASFAFRPNLPPEPPTVLKELTLRSGQELTVEGNLVLLGHVHQGATVRASGSIFVLGQLNGIAHAGYQGDVRAVILALVMQPSQLRIAHTVAIPPRSEDVRPYPEIARLSSGRILVEPYQRGASMEAKGWSSFEPVQRSKRPRLTPTPHPQYVP
ncbi:septum site-determining protein MinC [Thermanaeromonas toyohensis ToBE]|uniref:Probable septum site-determining protein MinC n=2 Tax=Thermanaeromonas TaxID=202949 RepID=A0A1W1W0M5_9FIRM|nr:septum site-determining protein MinC [Thermanaeromonas toyohensis ToBE]